MDPGPGFGSPVTIHREDGEFHVVMPHRLSRHHTNSLEGVDSHEKINKLAGLMSKAQLANNTLSKALGRLRGSGDLLLRPWGAPGLR